MNCLLKSLEVSVYYEQTNDEVTITMNWECKYTVCKILQLCEEKSNWMKPSYFSKKETDKI